MIFYCDNLHNVF